MNPILRSFLGAKPPKGSTPNKYQPHQGAKEKARRARRLALKPEPARVIVDAFYGHQYVFTGSNVSRVFAENTGATQ